MLYEKMTNSINFRDAETSSAGRIALRVSWILRFAQNDTKHVISNGCEVPKALPFRIIIFTRKQMPAGEIGECYMKK